MFGYEDRVGEDITTHSYEPLLKDPDTGVTVAVHHTEKVSPDTANAETYSIAVIPQAEFTAIQARHEG